MNSLVCLAVAPSPTAESTKNERRLARRLFRLCAYDSANRLGSKCRFDAFHIVGLKRMKLRELDLAPTVMQRRPVFIKARLHEDATGDAVGMGAVPQRCRVQRRREAN